MAETPTTEPIAKQEAPKIPLPIEQTKEVTQQTKEALNEVRLMQYAKVEGYTQLDHYSDLAWESRAAEVVPFSSCPDAQIYIIQPGDTFVEIAKSLNIAPGRIQAMNPNLKNLVAMYPGYTLSIPSGESIE